MKTLILFASRYGATEEIAYMLKSAVGGDVTVRNIRERGITLDGYDTVIIGSCAGTKRRSWASASGCT